MSKVYKARDLKLGTTVAIKMLRQEYLHNVQHADALRQEAAVMSRLQDRHVVSVYGEGEHDGVPYIVLEHVAGRTLRHVLNDAGSFNPRQALGITLQVLNGLSAAHRLGIVHRDIKPENILVGRGPQGACIKLIDFGIAQPTLRRRAGHTRRHSILATVAYLPPELTLAGAFDARSDVYSTGILLYEMLTGEVPYDGPDSSQVAHMHTVHTVPDPRLLAPDLPEDVAALVMSATARKPGHRFVDADDFACAALDSWRHERSRSQRPQRATASPAPSHGRAGHLVALFALIWMFLKGLFVKFAPARGSAKS